MGMPFKDMSSNEKSQWFVLVTVVVVYTGYFLDVVPGHGRDVAMTDVARFVAAVISLVMLQVAGHVVLAIADRRALARGMQRDERDTLIELRASRLASHVLAVGAFIALSVALQVPGNFAFIHVLFGSLVLSHVCELATRIVLYRRGV